MHPEEIIVKKIKKNHGGHHGGAWKVAYADFVTAMMALFMVLWLVAMMSAETRKAVAEYFRSFSLIRGDYGIGGGKLSHMPGEAIMLQPDPGGVQGGTAWERRLAEDIKKELEAKLSEAMDQVFVATTPGGVRIEIVERSGKAMFGLGEARLLEHGQKLLEIIARQIAKLPYPIWIEGHTDAHPYRMEAYTNWELSVDRANVVRKVLIANGVGEDKIMKVVGYAATDPLIKEDPYSPLNRRVSIVVKEQKEAEFDVKPVPGPVDAIPERSAPVFFPLEDSRAASARAPDRQGNAP